MPRFFGDADITVGEKLLGIETTLREMEQILGAPPPPFFEARFRSLRLLVGEVRREWETGLLRQRRG